MSYVTVEVDINHGQIVAREPEKLPEMAKGILTILTSEPAAPVKRERVRLPLIQGDGKHPINPTSADLDDPLG